MKKLTLILLSVLLSIGAWAETTPVSVPTTLGQFIDYTNTNVTSYNGLNVSDNGNWGSVKNGNWAQITLNCATDGDYVLVFKSGMDRSTDNDPRAVITVTDASSTTIVSATRYMQQTAGSWTPVTLHAVDMHLSAGSYTLRFDFKRDDSDYVGNFGAIAVYTQSDFDAASTQAIPQADGSFIAFSATNKGTAYGFCTLTNCSVDNPATVIGSTHEGSNIRLTLRNATEQAYLLALKSGERDGDANFTVTVRDTEGKVLMQSDHVAKQTSNWTPSQQHLLSLGTLPVGVLTLDFHVNSITAGTFAGNYGDVAIYAESAYDAAHELTLPTAVDGKIHLGTSGGSLENYCTLSNCRVDGNGDGYVIGSTGASSVMNLQIKNPTEQEYILSFQTGAKNCSAELAVTVKDCEGNIFTTNRQVLDINNFTPSTQHIFSLGVLPTGYYTLEVKVNSNTGSYAGNWGNFAIYALSSYNQCDGTNFDLTKGTYTGGARYEEKNQNVGNIKNGASAEYIMYNATEGVATLHMGLAPYNDGTVTVTVKDMLTGTTELTTSFVTTTDFCKGYDIPSDIQLGQLTTGLKSIRFDFANESGYICNYKNVNVTIQLPTITLINAVLNGGSNAPTVTGTYAGSAVAKTQATATEGGYKFDADCYVGLTLATGYTFKAGDVLHVNVTSKCTGGSKLALYSDLGTTFICTTGIGQETGDLTFTLTDAFNGLSTFYLYRSSNYAWNGYVASVSVEGVSRERVEQTYSVNYSLGESGAQGTVPAAIAAENILTKYAAPVNQTLYKEGYTLKGWTDGETEYLIGQLYDMTEGEHNLTPVFAANTETLAFVKSDLEVIWYFGINNSAPTYTGAADVQTKQVNLNNEMIDLAVLMAGGDNSGRNDEWMNNQQKNITVPVCAGAIVKAKVYYTNDAVFNGETITYNAEFGTQGNVVYTYVCPNTVGSTIDVNVGNQFLSYIQVQYPAHATISDQMTAEAMAALNGFIGDVTVNRSLTAGMFNTICLPFAMSADEITAAFGATRQLKKLSSAELTDDVLVLNFDDATTIEAGKPYLINPAAAVRGWTMENVTLSTTATSTVATSADFIGVLTPTELAASENTLCVGANNTLFYVNSTSTMKGLRAYFTVKGAAAGAPARISLGGQVATGVENVNDNANVSKLIEQGRVIIRIDGHDYDLNGRMIR